MNKHMRYFVLMVFIVALLVQFVDPILFAVELMVVKL